LQNCVIERKLIWTSADWSFSFLKMCLMKYKHVCLFMLCFYRRGCETWSMTLRVGSRLGLGTVLVLISTGSVMAVCNRIWE